MKRCVIIVMVLALFGCATTPTPISEARMTPADRIFYKPHKSEAMVTAVFVRDTGLTGSGIYKHLAINDEQAASIDVGEKVILQLAPGEYVFSVSATDPFGASAPFAIDQKLETGKTYYYRILTDGNTMSTRIQRMIGKSTN